MARSWKTKAELETKKNKVRGKLEKREERERERERERENEKGNHKRTEKARRKGLKVCEQLMALSDWKEESYRKWRTWWSPVELTHKRFRS